MSGEGLSAAEREVLARALCGDTWDGDKDVPVLADVHRRIVERAAPEFERIVARRESEAAEKARAEVVAGVRAWCAINEIAEAPLDWEGLGEFLARADSVAQGREEGRDGV